jgi:hypothetical protein
MRAYEWLAAAYFAAFAIAAMATPASTRRRVAVGLWAVLVATGVVAAARLAAPALRDWLPHVYLVMGYWLPALLSRAPVEPTRFEQWLHRTDAVLRSGTSRLPRGLRHVVEAAYLLCYPLVPAAFAIVWAAGSSADVDRFWLAVLIAGYACYASLPWLVSRPPRLASPSAQGPTHVARINVRVLSRVSHQLNTFPSGHVAVTMASAACVAAVSPLAGALVGSLGAAIALGAAAGRYHYVIDVVLGIVVAAFAAAVAFT